VMKLDRLIKDVDAIEVSGDDGVEISGLYYDSRKVEPGGLYFAIKGHNLDGHDYISESKERGAVAVVLENRLGVSGLTEVFVKDSRRAMGSIADTFFDSPSMKMKLFGVTGTNGKTTVCYIAEEIFKAAGFEAGIIGTVSYKYAGKSIVPLHTTPESLVLHGLLNDMVSEDVTHVAMEVSSHALDQGRVDACMFDSAVFTNLTQDHLDYHGTMESYFDSKARFFVDVANRKKDTLSVINIDDPWGARLLPKVAGDVLTYGIKGGTDISVSSFEADMQGVRGDVMTPFGAFEFSTNLLGEHNIYNILAAAGGALGMGLKVDDIASGLNGAIRVPGRLEAVNVEGGDAKFLVLVDYAHTDDAIKNVISTLSPLADGRLITVFGCGGDRDKKKRPLMAEAAASLSDKIIVTSDNPRTEDPDKIISDILEGFSGMDISEVSIDSPLWKGDEKIFSVIPQRREAIRFAIKNAKEGDIVLIAGKGHEDYQIIGKLKHPFDDRVEAAEALREFWAKGKTND
jgi:UDP-N-acetylmuramoyl-L-alanyl-D-glutamate--2,6-diaminopimelate ligase